MSSQARARAGKYTKPKRGGGKKFSRITNDAGEEENIWAIRDKPRNEASSDEEEDDDDDSEDDDSEESDSEPAKNLSREERRAIEKARKEAAKAKKQGKPEPGDLPPNSSDEDSEDEDEAGLPANPNHSAASKAQTKVDPAAAAAPAATPKGGKEALSRREREALAAQQAKERYAKLHAEGKTDEAKADLARLRLVRERREAEAARRKAEEEERIEQEKEKAATITDREAKLRAAAAGPNAKGKPLKKKK